MMLQVNVVLPNGHAELLSLLPSSTVQDVRTKAQRAFGKMCLRLITAKNRVLVDPHKTLEEAGIEDGECLMALVLQPQLAATGHAFASWCHGDRAIATWGNARYAGDSSKVQDELRSVQQIQATFRAFAAILADGSVVTWGHAGFGGDSSSVRNELMGVQQIQATRGAPPPASCTSTCSAPPGPCADKSTGCEGEENLQGILWPPASRRARRPRALC